MILDAFSDLNWIAIVVATIAWFVFSAIWYSFPAISAGWQRAARVDPGEEARPMVVLAVPTLIGYFVTSVVIALLAAATGAADLTDGIVLGVLLGLGFGTVGALVTQLYENKGGFYSTINGVNAVIAYAIVGAILAVWD